MKDGGFKERDIDGVLFDAVSEFRQFEEGVGREGVEVRGLGGGG
jgi:hypothetical protein